MPLRNLFRRYPQPHLHRIDLPDDGSYIYKPHTVPTANEIYNNATPQWVWNPTHGGWSLVYTYGGYQFTAMPDHRIANSWYANYGADPSTRQEPAWEWVWDPRLNEWVNRPVGQQIYGTAYGHPPADKPYSSAYTHSKSSGRSWYAGRKIVKPPHRASGSRLTTGGSGFSRVKSRWNAFLGK